MYKIAILDRDGVINKPSTAYVKSVAEWRPIAGSIDAIARMSKAGIKVVIATNQSAIARGLLDVGELNAMHRKMHSAVELAGGRIDAVFFCPHHPSINCDCRKPKSGMIFDILSRFKVSPEEAFMIGDNERDIAAAMGANVKPYFVLTGQGLGNREALKKKLQVDMYDDLATLVTHLIAQKLI
jgi:D-glycero-D-manno-heptose 1,7-bisphosphate phosphatase